MEAPFDGLLINDNITLDDVITWVLPPQLLSQRTVLGCLLLILLSAILHPLTTHLHCPDFLSLVIHKSRIHTVSLDTGMFSENRQIPVGLRIR